MDAKTKTLTPAAQLAGGAPIRIPNESAAYREARRALLAEEIELRRHKERVAAMRRALPQGAVVAADYRFIGRNGETDLAGLFAGKDTLYVYTMMFGPERERACPMCTNHVGALAASAADIRQNIALALVARSPIERLIAFAEERGWKDLPVFSDPTDAYSRDWFCLQPDGSESGATNVFTRRDGVIRHFWSEEMPAEAADPGQDSRGAVEMAALWSVLDFTPRGRRPDWYPSLSY